MPAPPFVRRFRISRIVCGFVVFGWLIAVAGGMVLLERYAHRPGELGAGVELWPQGSDLPPPAGDRWTLVVALHPECPCSRATVEELNQLLAQRPGALDIYALFVADQAEAMTSDLWEALGRMPAVHVAADPRGVEARRFGFRTSGEVRLYAADRGLRFHGGITISRGHIGANPGSAAIRAALDSPHRALVQTPVFGCALFDSEEAAVPR